MMKNKIIIIVVGVVVLVGLVYLGVKSMRVSSPSPTPLDSGSIPLNTVAPAVTEDGRSTPSASPVDSIVESDPIPFPSGITLATPVPSSAIVNKFIMK